MEFENQYLTYEEYQSLGGNLTEMPFNLLEFKARTKINELTFNRLKDLKNQIQEVKLCIYELIKQYNIENDTKNIASESIGNYSVSYVKSNINEEYTTQINNIIETYLSNCVLDNGTPYLYRGL